MPSQLNPLPAYAAEARPGGARGGAFFPEDSNALGFAAPAATHALYFQVRRGRAVASRMAVAPRTRVAPGALVQSGCTVPAYVVALLPQRQRGLTRHPGSGLIHWLPTAHPRRLR